MSRRRLRPEELELWQQIARSTEPMHRHRTPKETLRETVTPKSPKVPVQPLPDLRFNQSPTGGDTYQPPVTTANRLRSEPVRMDSKAFGRLKRGKLVPEARIDLHGMTLDQAHPALVGFILTAQSRGLRLVLVITGKGSREDPYDPMPRRRGVLKSQVPQWLRMAPIGQGVLQISEAHQRHGGTGAYYVYLKRRR